MSALRRISHASCFCLWLCLSSTIRRWLMPTPVHQLSMLAFRKINVMKLTYLFSIQHFFSMIIWDNPNFPQWFLSSTEPLLLCRALQFNMEHVQCQLTFTLGRPCALTILIQITNRFGQHALHSESIFSLDMYMPIMPTWWALPNTSYTRRGEGGGFFRRNQAGDWIRKRDSENSKRILTCESGSQMLIRHTIIYSPRLGDRFACNGIWLMVTDRVYWIGQAGFICLLTSW